MITIIVAIDDNNAIGKNNQLPWHLSDDLKRFKAITMGHTVIMGRKTWESLPFKPLKGRRNIVISETMKKVEGCEIARSIKDAVSLINENEKAYIIGGARIYQQTINIAEELLVTHISTKIADADTFFPIIDKQTWNIKELSEIFIDKTNQLKYQYITYRRNKL